MQLKTERTHRHIELASLLKILPEGENEENVIG